MGLFFKEKKTDVSATGSAVTLPGSPWSDTSTLQPVPAALLTDLYGPEFEVPITWDRALTIDAVAKGRNILVGAFAPLPLKALKGGTPVANQPTFLYRSDTNVSPYFRMMNTLDSLIAYGQALWAVDRSPADGSILDASWVPDSRWRVEKGAILVDDKPVQSEDVLYFQGPMRGLINQAQSTLRSAINIERQADLKANSPAAFTILHQTDQAQISQQELDTYLAAFDAARMRGKTGYLPHNITLETHGDADPVIFAAAQNQARLKIGAHLHIPSVLMDSTLSEASLTYTTAETNLNRLFAETFPFWLSPIEARLSMDDVVPRGQVVKFDRGDLLTPNASATGPILED